MSILYLRITFLFLLLWETDILIFSLEVEFLGWYPEHKLMKMNIFPQNYFIFDTLKPRNYMKNNQQWWKDAGNTSYVSIIIQF